MDNFDLLNKYLSLSREIMALNIFEDYERFQEIIAERENVLNNLEGLKEENEETEKLCKEIIEIDADIVNKIEDEKELIEKEILDIKREKTKSTMKKQVLKTYVSRNKNNDSYYFDKKK